MFEKTKSGPAAVGMKVPPSDMLPPVKSTEMLFKRPVPINDPGIDNSGMSCEP